MLTNEDNETLTRVGPGTPMGELFRRFWLPALLASEVSEPDGAPVRLRILCEDLLAFRASDGQVGIVEAYCSHRGAPLYFGRNEQGGLRCAYHGWKFAADGECIDVPNADHPRDNSKARAKLGIRAYPTREAGGIGWLQRSNWLQGAEGEIDTSHISFLHKDHDPATSAIYVTGANLAVDGAPEITVKETDYGFASGARRQLGDEYFWRVTQWLLPMYSLIPRAPSTAFTGSGGRAWVPIDDYNTTTFAYAYRVDQPLSADELDMIEKGAHFPPRTARHAVQLGSGQPIDAFVPLANFDNDYLIDRDRQRTSNFSGIAGFSAQDRYVQEARELQQGLEPDLVMNGDAYGVRAISKVCATAGFDEFLQQFGHECAIQQEETK